MCTYYRTVSFTIETIEKRTNSNLQDLLFNVEVLKLKIRVYSVIIVITLLIIRVCQRQ